jgi:cobalt/nickel transport protein
MRSANSILSVMIVMVIVLAANSVSAHFGMIIPSDSMVMQKDNRNVDLVLSFSHPFEGQGMELAKPVLSEFWRMVKR